MRKLLETIVQLFQLSFQCQMRVIEREEERGERDRYHKYW